jgi:hypothetical protein
MRRIKTMGLCLAAVFAISAVASGSAWAAAAPPEYYGINSCTTKFGRLWNGGNCVTGRYKTTEPTPAGATAIKVANKAKNGEMVKITGLSGGAPLEEGKTYFVVAESLTTLSLATEKGGIAIQLTTQLNSATFTVSKFLAAQKISYTGTAGASKLDGGLVIECTAATTKGSTLGSTKLVKVVSTFTGCHLGGLASKCQTKLPSEGGTEGLIKTANTKGHLTEASEKSGGLPELVPTVTLEPETSPFEFAKFVCGTKGEIKVSVKGKIIEQRLPVFFGTPEEKNDSKLAKSIAEAKEVIKGCGGQKFLYEHGLEPCLHLRTIENEKELEPSWDEFQFNTEAASPIQIFKKTS